MESATTIAEVRQAVGRAKKAGKRVGFVPTMGALHEGHASLIRQAAKATGFVVVSIFVNPKQFGPNEDLHRYPRPLEEDKKLCQAAGAHLVYHPAVEVVYPEGFQTFVEVDGLGQPLCGKFRPEHFRGVATVVLKLFNQVCPDMAFFGQKDAQQAILLKKMVTDLDVPVEMVICPTVREADGLAMSSRNRYLSPQERERATIIYQSLVEIKKDIEGGKRAGQELTQKLRACLDAIPGVVVDYAEIVSPATLQPLAVLSGEALLAVAVRIGSTRLIDNLLVKSD